MNTIILVVFIIGSFAAFAQGTKEKEPHADCNGCEITKMTVTYKGDPADGKKMAKIKNSKKPAPEMNECIITVNKDQCIELLQPLTFKKVKVNCKKGLMPLNKVFDGEEWEKAKEDEEVKNNVGPTGMLRIKGKGTNEPGLYCPEVDTVDLTKYKDKVKVAKGTTTCEITAIFEEGEFSIESSTTIECK